MMKHVCHALLSVLLLISYSAFSFAPRTIEDDSLGVFIPQDEYATAYIMKTHLWVDMKNIVMTNRPGEAEILQIWCSNGTAQKAAYYSPGLATVTPADSGEVKVYTVQRIQTDYGWDTLTTTNVFKAVFQPEILILPVLEELTTSGTLTIMFADKGNLKPLPASFVVAQPFDVYVYDEELRVLGKLPAQTTSVIQVDLKSLPFQIQKGYHLSMQPLVRDKVTDLVMAAEELVYQIK